MQKLQAATIVAGWLLTIVGTVCATPLTDQIISNPTNPSWLFRPSGDPIFICGPGDPEGFLYRGSENPDGTRSGDQDAIISKLTGTGANCIYLMAVRSHGGDGDASQNPFYGHDPANELNGVLLDQWVDWLSALDDAGVVIHFFLYDDGARIWNTGDTVGPQEEAFIQALVDQFKFLRNLVWCVAEEYAEAYTQTRASNLAATLRSADEHEHPIAIHQNSGLNFDFPSDPNIDQFAMQYNVGTASALHAGVLQAFQDAGGSYVLNLAEAENWGTGAVARKKSWACAMGGAYVMVLGMDVVSTPSSDLEDCGRVVSFFESTSFTSMSPRDDLARDGTRWVLADPGNAYIAYADAAGSALGLQDLPSGSWDLRWYDCVSGNTVEQPGVITSGGATTWTKPGGLGDEVALYVLDSGATAIEPTNWAKVKAAFR